MAVKDFYSRDLRIPEIVCARCGVIIIGTKRANHLKFHKDLDKLISIFGNAEIIEEPPF